MSTAQPFTLSNGRTLDLFLGGAPSGTPLVLHHGTPSDATTFADWDETCRTRGLKLICFSRPGYATSPRAPGRNVAAIAALTATLLDDLGLATFHTAGWSGGGPHALACAALLPARCIAAATLAGVAPYGAPDLDFMAGMGPENVTEFTAATQGEAAYRTLLEATAEPFRHITGEQVAESFGGLVPQIDKDELTGGYADAMATMTRRALAGGFDGWIDDGLAFTQPWGFAPQNIIIPVTIWQGDLDLMVPHTHGAWLATHIPTATHRLAPGHGHISLVTRYREAILDDLMQG